MENKKMGQDSFIPDEKIADGPFYTLTNPDEI